MAGGRSVGRLASQAPNAASSGSSIRRAAADQAGAQTPESALAATLSPAQLAGQRVIYSFSGLTPPPALLKLIRHGEVGGVIFFSSNFANPTQFTAAVAKLVSNNSLVQNPAHKPNLGSSRPAGLSFVIVQGQLRRRLGYTGSLSQSAFRANVAQVLTLRSGLPDPSIGAGRA
jgi:hypothetical protein